MPCFFSRFCRFAQLSEARPSHLPPLLKFINQSSHINHETSRLLSQNQTETIHEYDFFSLLGSSQSLGESRKIHALLVVSGLLGLNAGIDIGAQLVNAYISLDSLQEAVLVVHQLPNKSIFLHNSLLRGLVSATRYEEALEFFQFMLGEGMLPDNYTYPLVLRACSGLSDLEKGKEIKNIIYYSERDHKRKPNIFVECALVDMFCKCGSLSEARQIFEKMSERDLVSWTAMVCGTVQHGDWPEALVLFRRMRLDGFSPDSVIVATILPACGRLGAFKQGAGLHGFSLRNGFQNDLCVSNALIDMYCRCGNTNEACAIFNQMEVKDAISWGSLIVGRLLNDEHVETLSLFVKMIESDVRPGSVTIAGVLPAFSDLRQFKQGKEIHGYATRRGYDFDGFVASALVDMYAKCGAVREAEFIFKMASDKDVAVWNSMIMAYAINDDADLVFKVLRGLQESNFRPNSITVMSAVPVCARVGALKLGREMHGYATRNGLTSVVSVQNSLIDMYCKCGSLEQGMEIFYHMVEKDIVTYNTMIAAIGMHGLGTRAFSLFNQMKKEKIRPNKLTFISLLSACSHVGLTAEGGGFYNSMIEEYGILPEMEHYSCMVDLLGRSGCIDEAWEFIEKMPVNPDIDVLGSLLGACRIHKRVDIAELVGNRIFDMQPVDPGYYILLSNTYAALGRSADALKVRNMIKEKGLVKKPGSSWIQIGCRVYVFQARDRAYMQIAEIRMNVENLLLQMKDEGYVPDLSYCLHDLRADDNGIQFSIN